MSRSAIVRVRDIKEKLRSNALPPRIPHINGHFNCWGFVAYYYQHQMEMLLAFHTQRITTPSTGDVAVFHKDGELNHSAIVLEGKVRRVCHKRGGNALCIETLNSAAKYYGEVSFHRPNPT
jgi:cell wall-associated NlpC family hydrolase